MNQQQQETLAGIVHDLEAIGRQFNPSILHIRAAADKLRGVMRTAGKPVMCYLQEEDPPEDHDVSRYSAVCGRCYAAQVEVSEADISRLRKCVKEWVDYFDNLKSQNPGDPLADARELYHGGRIERCRAALAATAQQEPAT